MEKELLLQRCIIGSQFVPGKPRGIQLIFHGLGCSNFGAFSTEELELAKIGYLPVFPFYGPWSWMSPVVVPFIDDVVESVFQYYGLPENAPILSTGGSMGGHSALIYPRYAKRPIAGVIAKCPVCDLEYHFSEREDLPRSMQFAYSCYGGNIAQAFAEFSPVNQVENMPHVPYIITHGTADQLVSKEHHSDVLVEKMKAAGMDVTYLALEHASHCAPLPLFAIGEMLALGHKLLG